MRFMVFVPANGQSEAGVMPDEQLFTEMGKFNEEMVKAGVMLAGEGLAPSSKGARLQFQGGGKTRVVDGPFTESKELVAGFWIIETKSKQEAIEWMKRAPFGEGVTLEIRQIVEMDDLGEGFTPELRAQEERLRAMSEANKKH